MNTTENKKIVITVPSEGGPLTYAELLKDELPKKGIDVEIVSFGDVMHLPKIVRHIAFMLKLIIASSKADVLFAQDPVSTGLPTLIASKITGKIFLMRIAGDYAWEQGRQFHDIEDDIEAFQKKEHRGKVRVLKKIQSYVAEKAGCVITPSKYFASIVRQWGKVEPTVIYNGISLDVRSQKPSLNVPEKSIVSVGRLVPWKGFRDLITMLKDLPDWHLFIIGEGEEELPLKDHAKEMEVIDRVSFVGRVSRKEVYGFFKDADVFVLNTFFESFSFLTVEAMDAGIPVVVSRVGSIPELVRDGVDGILFEPSNKEQIKKAILSVYEGKNMKNSMVSSAKSRAKKFSIQNTVDKINKVINNL